MSFFFILFVCPVVENLSFILNFFFKKNNKNKTKNEVEYKD